MTSNISIFIKTKTKQKKNREIKVKKIRFFLYFKIKKNKGNDWKEIIFNHEDELTSFVPKILKKYLFITSLLIDAER